MDDISAKQSQNEMLARAAKKKDCATYALATQPERPTTLKDHFRREGGCAIHTRTSASLEQRKRENFRNIARQHPTHKLDERGPQPQSLVSEGWLVGREFFLESHPNKPACALDHPTMVTDSESVVRKNCVRGEGVHGVLTLICSGVAQTWHDDRVVELKEQLVVEEVDGERQEGKVKEEGRGRVKENAP